MKIAGIERIELCLKCKKITINGFFCSKSCERTFMIDDDYWTVNVHCLGGCRKRIWRIGFCSDSCGQRWAKDVADSWKYVDRMIEGINNFDWKNCHKS